jgi:hypothetical protein
MLDPRLDRVYEALGRGLGLARVADVVSLHDEVRDVDRAALAWALADELERAYALLGRVLLGDDDGPGSDKVGSVNFSERG